MFLILSWKMCAARILPVQKVPPAQRPIPFSLGAVSTILLYNLSA